MTTKSYDLLNRLVHGALGAALLVCACSPDESLRREPTEAQMSDHLLQLYIVLRAGEALPVTLAELGETGPWSGSARVDPALFVCPGTGTHPGPMKEVQSWTDYIYVGNRYADALTGVPLVISPPENHSGRHGFVLFSDGVISLLPPEATRRLIQDPFCMATNESSENIASARRNTLESIPERLRAYYPPGMVFSNAWPYTKSH